MHLQWGPIQVRRSSSIARISCYT
uniref:Uncharacterized protein n=1 Tax=Arundo donax TaxID=35708 RepID=A0A0A9GDW3_ARUDO